MIHSKDMTSKIPFFKMDYFLKTGIHLSGVFSADIAISVAFEVC